MYHKNEGKKEAKPESGESEVEHGGRRLSLDNGSIVTRKWFGNDSGYDSRVVDAGLKQVNEIYRDARHDKRVKVL